MVRGRRRLLNGYTIPTALLCALIGVGGVFLNGRISAAAVARMGDHDEVLRLKTALDMHLDQARPQEAAIRDMVPAVARLEEQNKALMVRQEQFNRDMTDIKQMIRGLLEERR